VAEAKPAIILVVASTCLVSIEIVSFPAITTALAKETPSRVIVNDALALDVLATEILVTTAVVADGVVYRVVLDVAAAPRYRALDVTAICTVPFC
jgi:hypothetical protein